MNKQTVIPLSLLLIFIIGCASRTTIKPFTSDDCSCWPEGYDQKRQWEECCREHDLAYWAGGSYQERLEADERLRECVERTGDSAVARLMFYGVRVGGTAFLPLPWRWGYGWDFMRGYQPLTRRERKMVERMKKKYRVTRSGYRGAQNMRE